LIHFYKREYINKMKAFKPLNDEHKNIEPGSVDFVLIGAGLPRTGTASTHAALLKILPGNCHHMQSVFLDRSGKHTDFFMRACKGEVTPQEWRDFVRSEGLSAGVDYPMSLFWRQLMDVFPDAKVLFTDRDPVKWYESVTNTVFKIVQFGKGLVNLPLRAVMPRMDCGSKLPYYPYPGEMGEKHPRGMFGAIEGGQEEAVKFYKDLKEFVIKEVPEERLLVWHAREGWAPLCRFLGVPEPSEPFPNTNDTASMLKRINAMRTFRNVVWAVMAGVVGGGAYYLL